MDYFMDDPGDEVAKFKERLRQRLMGGPSVTDQTFAPLNAETDRLGQRVEQLAQPDRLRRALRPEDAMPEPNHSGTYTLPEMGDATVDHEPSFGRRLLGGIQRIAGSAPFQAAMTGLSRSMSPDEDGALGQVGAFARGFSTTRAAEAQQQQDRLLAQKAADDRTTTQRTGTLRDKFLEAQADRERAQADHLREPPAPKEVRPLAPRTGRAGDMQQQSDGSWSYIQPTNTAPPIPHVPRASGPGKPVVDKREAAIQRRALELVRGSADRAPMDSKAARAMAEREVGDIMPGGKSPQQWFDEVDGEHPNWTEEQVRAEARRRAGSR